MAIPTSGLFCLYEAKSESGKTDGDALSTVVDQSGNGYNLSAAGGAEPHWEDAELNGHAIYRFDGGDLAKKDSLSISAVTAFTLSAVVSSGAGEAASRVWPFAVTNLGTVHIFAVTEGVTSGEWGSFTRTSASTTIQQTTSGADTTGWTVLTIEWDGTTVRFYRDGTFVGEGSVGGSFFNPAVNSQIQLGQLVDQYFTGDIAVAAAWTRALGATDRAALHTYVQDTYGITVSDYTAPASSLLLLSNHLNGGLR